MCLLAFFRPAVPSLGCVAGFAPCRPATFFTTVVLASPATLTDTEAPAASSAQDAPQSHAGLRFDWHTSGCCSQPEAVLLKSVCDFGFRLFAVGNLQARSFALRASFFRPPSYRPYCYRSVGPAVMGLPLSQNVVQSVFSEGGRLHLRDEDRPSKPLRGLGRRQLPRCVRRSVGHFI